MPIFQRRNLWRIQEKKNSKIGSKNVDAINVLPEQLHET